MNPAEAFQPDAPDPDLSRWPAGLRALSDDALASLAGRLVLARHRANVAADGITGRPLSAATAMQAQGARLDLIRAEAQLRQMGGLVEAERLRRRHAARAH